LNWHHRLAQFKAVMGIMHGGRVFTGPFQTRLSLSNRCNIRCIHCYFFSPYLEKATSMTRLRDRQVGRQSSDGGQASPVPRFDADTETTKALIREMINTGTSQFLFSGRGEPFVHKDALELMGFAKRGGARCLVNTNGTLLDRKAIDELVNMGFDELRITVMAGSRDVYMRTHPDVDPETFDSLKENLLYLAERKAAGRRRKPKITLVCIVVAQNHNGLFEFAEFAAGVSAERVLYRPIDNVEDRGLAKIVLTPEQAFHVRKRLAEVAVYLHDRGISHNIEDFLRGFHGRLDTTAFYRFLPCYYVWLASMVEVDGTVYPCCRCFHPMGNAREEGFTKVWNGEAYGLFRREALQIHTRKIPVRGCACNSCVNHEANSRIYRMLHPIKWRVAEREMRHFCP
jgi:MoaA/NifB/PqqE/SkfB family radical SAM enzyme